MFLKFDGVRRKASQMLAPLVAHLDEARSYVERLSAREKFAVVALAATLGLLMVGGLSYAVVARIQGLEQQIEDSRQALTDLAKYKDQYLANRRSLARLDYSLSSAPLELNSYVDTAAAAVNVKIDESSEAKDADGEAFSRRGLNIKLRQISISQLANFLQRLEDSGRHVVQVTELSVSTRWEKHEELDVELVVSTYLKKQQGGAVNSIGGESDES